MQGKALLLFGSILTLSATLGPADARGIVAQTLSPASTLSTIIHPARGPDRPTMRFVRRQMTSRAIVAASPTVGQGRQEGQERKVPSSSFPGQRSSEREMGPAPRSSEREMGPAPRSSEGEMGPAPRSSEGEMGPAPRSAERVVGFPSVIDQPDIAYKHKVIASEVFALLPVTCQSSLKNFYVRYEKPDRRGLAGKSTVIIDGTLPDDEFRAVLIHELMGHFFDLGCVNGTPKSGRSTFFDGPDPVYQNDPSLQFYRISWSSSAGRRSDAVDADFVSGYSKTDPFEDFAESVTYYLLHQESFVARAAQDPAIAAKLQWFQTYLPLERSVAVDSAPSISIPWDATKLPYAWAVGNAIAQR